MQTNLQAFYYLEITTLQAKIFDKTDPERIFRPELNSVIITENREISRDGKG